MPPHAFLQVNYEDIVRDQEAESRRLLAFAGLPWEDRVLRFHESQALPDRKRGADSPAVYSSSVRKWRHYAERLMPLRDRLAREVPAAELA